MEASELLFKLIHANAYIHTYLVLSAWEQGQFMS